MNNLSKMNIENELKVRFGDNYKDHFPLSSVLPIGVGGVGYMYVVADTTSDIIDAAKIAIVNKLPYVVIGSASATIIGESGFPGVVIKNNTKNIFRVGQSSRVVCDSGSLNTNIVNSMASVGLGGVEFLDSIPGTVGGAVVTDAEMGERKVTSYVREASVFDPDSGRVVTVGADELKKIIKQIVKGNLVHPIIILTVTLQFAQLAQNEIIRRLSIIKQSFTPGRDRVIGYVFSQKLKEISIKRESLKHIKGLNASYDKFLDRFYLGSACTPMQLKEAIKIIDESAKDFGIETEQKITYLGYYQEETDE